MILLEKIIRIDFGAAPFTHYWTFTDPCLVVKSSEIVEENGEQVLKATIEAYNESCITNNSTATLYLEDSEGCKLDFEVALSTPCGNTEFIYSTGIVRTDSLVFSAPVIKTQAPYTYTWTYNDTLFEVIEQKDDSIKLKLKEKVYVKEDLNSQISVSILDKYNCEINSEFVFKLAAPSIGEIPTITTVCLENSLVTTNTVTLPVEPAFAEIQECYVEACETTLVVTTQCAVGDNRVKVTGLNPQCIVQLSQSGVVKRTLTAGYLGEVEFLQLASGTYQISSSNCTDCAFDEDLYICTDNNSKFKEIPINWNTLSLIVPSGVTWTNIGEGKVEVNFPAGYPTGVVKIPFFVEDYNSVRVQGEICIDVQPCYDEFLIPDITNIISCTDCQQSITDGIIASDSGLCNDEPITLSLEDRLKGLNVDWTSLEFIVQAGQVFGNDTLAGVNDFTAIIDRNRNLIISPDGTTFGTGYFDEDIRLKVKDNSGQETQFSVHLLKDSCDDVPVPVDDAVCLIAGETLSKFDVTANDKNVDSVTSFVITQFPAASLGNFSVTNKGLITIESSAVADGVYTAKYKVNDSLLEGTITITVINNSGSDSTVSYCSTDASEVNLYALAAPSSDAGYWVYAGKKVLINDETFTNGTFAVLDEPIATYVPNARLTASGEFAITVTITSDPGFHHFKYIVGNSPCQEETEVIIETVAPTTLITDYTHKTCETTGDFDINNIVVGEATLGNSLPTGGTWLNLNPGTLSVPTFSPTTVGEGTYTFSYTVTNTGTYNTICSSVFMLNIVVEAEVYAGEDTCLKVCSDGPGEGDPGFACRLVGDYEKDYDGTGECEFCLDSKLNTSGGKTITTGGTWILTGGPYATNVPLYINNKIYFLDVYDPTGSPNQKEEDYTLPDNPCIDFSHLDLGDYEFTYKVGDACKDEAKLIVSIFPAPCDAVDLSATYCGTRPEVSIYTLMLELLGTNPVCTPSTRGNWKDVSIIPPATGVLTLNADNDGTNDLINPELVLPPDADPGDDATIILEYTYFPDFTEPSACTAETCEPECETCFKTITLTLLFSQSDIAATADNLTTCNGTGTCDITLYDRITNGTTGGDWYYVGCNGTVKTAIDPDCNIGLVVGGSTRYPSRNNSLGDDTLAIDFSSATKGFYWFEYIICNDDGCCVTTTLIIQVVELLNPGTDTVCDICTTDNYCINLFRTLGGTPFAGGTWENTNNSATIATAGCNDTTPCGTVTTSTAGGFFDDIGGTGIDASFNTKDQVRGAHIFEYTVYDPPAEFEIDKTLCPACTNPTATVTVNLNDDTCLGSINNYSICTDSCPVNIFDRLVACVGDTSQDMEGGSWTYDGCNLVSNTGPDMACAVAVTVPAGDRIQIDMSGKSVGFYYFTYTLCNPDGLCCNSLQLVVEVVNELCAGADIECTLCENNPECIDVFAKLLENSTCGAVATGGFWTNLDNAPTINNACVGDAVPGECGEGISVAAAGFYDDAAGATGSTIATIDTTGLAVGTYRFKYTVSLPQTTFEYNPEGCITCEDSIATFTLTIEAGTLGGDPLNPTLCA